MIATTPLPFLPKG